MNRCAALPRCLATMLLAWTLAAAAQDPLPATVHQALREAGIPAGALAAVALPMGHAAAPWRHGAERAMQPGSSMKVLTAAVALDLVGPRERGHTELRSAAPLQDGTLQGDLVLRGGADPQLGVAQFWALLVDLRQAGVQHIAGDLIVDRTLFRPARPDLGLPPFDEAPEFPYNVIPDALHLAGSLLPLQLQATADGLQAAAVPTLPGLELASRMALNDRPCGDWDEDWAAATVTRQGELTRIELQGAFPRGCSRRVALQLLDRQELTERLFRGLWQGLGGRWAGRAREGAAPAGSRLLARREAAPWAELVRPILKSSDNALTRLLYLSLGVPAMAAQPQASTAELAAQAVRGWLAAQGIDDRGVVLDNGSGLSRSERISPLQMAQVIQAAAAGRHGADLLAALPVAGVDGTLRNRLKTGPATGWARLKTGTLRNVAALAGTLRDVQGHSWVVAMMINHEPLGDARKVLDALVDSLAREGPPGSVARATVGPQGEGP